MTLGRRSTEKDIIPGKEKRERRAEKFVNGRRRVRHGAPERETKRRQTNKKVTGDLETRATDRIFVQAHEHTNETQRAAGRCDDRSVLLQRQTIEPLTTKKQKKHVHD